MPHATESSLAQQLPTRDILSAVLVTLEDSLEAQRTIADRLQNLEQVVERRGAFTASNTPDRNASSVEVKSSTRGVDVAVKSYVGSPLNDIADLVVEEYFRVLRLAQQRIDEVAFRK